MVFCSYLEAEVTYPNWNQIAYYLNKFSEQNKINNTKFNPNQFPRT